MTDRWFVASLKPPGFFGAAHAVRNSSTHLSRQGIESYCPFLEPDEPVFPGYIFVHFDLESQPGLVRSINATRGISRLLPLHLQRPLSIPDGFIFGLQHLVDDRALSKKQTGELFAKYLPKETVHITLGPFAGFDAEFKHYRKGAAVLLIALLGRATEITVPTQQLLPKRRDAPVR